MRDQPGGVAKPWPESLICYIKELFCWTVLLFLQDLTFPVDSKLTHCFIFLHNCSKVTLSACVEHLIGTSQRHPRLEMFTHSKGTHFLLHRQICSFTCFCLFKKLRYYLYIIKFTLLNCTMQCFSIFTKYIIYIQNM